MSVAVNSDEMFSNYLYQSSTSKSFRNFDHAAQRYINEFSLEKDAYIIDVGSNDGIGLKPFLDDLKIYKELNLQKIYLT